MIALIDADNVAMACAFSAEEATVENACARAHQMVDNVTTLAGANQYELWLSGKGNFRYNIYPEYKATRKAPRPKWEQDVKQYMREHMGANTSDKCEADDMLGVRATTLGENSVLCHLDKDMDMIPGWHFGWELVRLGKVVREAKRYFVTPEEALRAFCYQLICGDNTDNIKGIVGAGPKAASRILSAPSDEWIALIREAYDNDEEFEMNAACLYIWRKENDTWKSLLNDGVDNRT